MTPVTTPQCCADGRRLPSRATRGCNPYIGDIYEHGPGVPEDYAEAVKWSRLASQ